MARSSGSATSSATNGRPEMATVWFKGVEQFNMLSADLTHAGLRLASKDAKATRKIGQDVVADGQAFAPVDTGNLRAGIGVDYDGDGLGSASRPSRQPSAGPTSSTAPPAWCHRPTCRTARRRPRRSARVPRLPVPGHLCRSEPAPAGGRPGRAACNPSVSTTSTRCGRICGRSAVAARWGGEFAGDPCETDHPGPDQLLATT